ncbi:MAG: hypothetical protein A2667_00445 [Candidatus Wildermuthbacteria bacterium RIFCSPHIGHO2_01_FULL_47_27]|uniref:Uncharacterized protein n=1 Tax=Candidatus Wildermuthbacteria bacterium RIFCSPLOWO2_01_FULL_48_35 TaxID=1802463 RepID=A0A1G2RN32_9BACT|nr:MAG: hypothetical protein UY15_C0024G0002 [Parcubacteria group bacterium GW2011_GWA2_47_9]OHA64199.1 MAG: hypothetical protein A2667_00445 [Candidatus Wildermuthbacteria bacterium RIFCSPHIGHO2_01_FULL_47_27]OHA73692.1 MAG: hypothetical protein A3A32_00960 [Candidatus Wildermuthbacteria bacterium RIFCSPLOWO2_01_FULL_48_35]
MRTLNPSILVRIQARQSKAEVSSDQDGSRNARWFRDLPSYGIPAERRIQNEKPPQKAVFRWTESYIFEIFNVMEQLSKAELKELNVRLRQIRVTIKELDEFLATRPHIYRSLRGHCFEVWFDRVISEADYNITKIGGDTVHDRKLNGKTLQLKTFYIRGSPEKGRIVQFRMHKTHGSERYPDALYLPREFADFFVGLHPNGHVIICPRNNMPKRGEVNPKLKYPEYIADSTPFPWDTEWLDRYDLLGVRFKSGVPTVSNRHKGKLFPKLEKVIGFSDYEIVKSLISPENFRMWQQLIVGSIREYHFEKFASKLKIKLLHPKVLNSARTSNKVDYVLKDMKRIQVKGVTKSLCRDDKIGCETFGSHSHIPTRLYKKSDFDILTIVIDPGTIPAATAKKRGIPADDYNFIFFKMQDLPSHPRSKEWGEKYIMPRFFFDARKARFNDPSVLLKSFK